MTEARDALLLRVRQALMVELGLQEWRIPAGWNYKQSGKIVAFAGKKRALMQVSAKLPLEEAARMLERVDVEPHPQERLAAAGWITINVYEDAQLPLVLDCVRTSIRILTEPKSREAP